MPVTSSVSPLAGVRDVNATHMMFAYQDLAGKVAVTVSTVNALVSAVSALNTQITYMFSSLQLAMVCATSLASALSTANLGSNTAIATIALTSFPGTIVNFTA